MKRLKFNIGSLMLVMAVSAFALWITIPAKLIRISISPKNKLSLNGVEYASEVVFWGEFRKRIDACNRWRINPSARISVPQSLGHPPAIDLMLSVRQFGVSDTKVEFYNQKAEDLNNVEP